MTKKEQPSQETVQENKSIPAEHDVKHEGQHLKDTENTKGHQFEPSRRTTNK